MFNTLSFKPRACKNTTFFRNHKPIPLSYFPFVSIKKNEKFFYMNLTMLRIWAIILKFLLKTTP